MRGFFCLANGLRSPEDFVSVTASESCHRIMTNSLKAERGCKAIQVIRLRQEVGFCHLRDFIKAQEGWDSPINYAHSMYVNTDKMGCFNVHLNVLVCDTSYEYKTISSTVHTLKRRKMCNVFT